MKIKVSEASGEVLDYMVAKCEGYDCQLDGGVARPWLVPQAGYLHDERSLQCYEPSVNWRIGGPIIEREGIGHFCNRTTKIGARFKPDAGADWRAFEYNKHGVHYFGPTPLIAAMRCYVTSKLGEKVEVPDELLHPM